MTVSNLIDREVFIRLDDDETAFICTVKRWPISRKTRIFVVEPAHQAFEPTVQKRSAELRDAEDDRGGF